MGGIPIVFHQQFMSVKETRIVSAHVSIFDAFAIYYIPRRHIFQSILHSFSVNVWWHTPLVFFNKSVLCLPRCQFRRFFFEFVGKWFVIEESPWIFVYPVKTVFD